MRYTGGEEKRGMTIGMQFLSGIQMVFWLIMTLIANSSFVLGLNINEVEQNPAGTDTGFEWVELYSETNINLEGYYLQADNKIYNLSGGFSGFLVVVFDTQFLDNSNEAVFLKNSNGLVDETPLLNDPANNGKTQQNCDGSWALKDSTQNMENDCESQQSPTNSTSGQNNNEQSINEDEENINDEDNSSEITLLQNNNQNNLNQTLTNNLVQQPKKIVLNAKNAEDDKNNDGFISNKEKVRRGVLYSFIGFLVVLVILLAWRKL